MRPPTRDGRGGRPSRGRAAFSIIELMVVLTIMSILLAFSLPSFQITLEQSKADVAMANLRAIWSAERVYWLANRTYVSDLTVLLGLDLIDPSIVSGTPNYTYAIPVADAVNLSVTATRTGSTVWQGSFAIDQTGLVTGVVQAPGEPQILPTLQ